MSRITCECGHVNPEGTVLCEACGKPFEENQHLNDNKPEQLLNMRYDGSARRSQTYQRTFVDKVWNFFSSVKIGVSIIILLVVASAVGTIFPQEMYLPPGSDPTTHYEEQYGMLGQIYYQLGFHNLYSSWWYLLIIAMLGVSIVIASIDRFIPLYKTLRKQKPKRHVNFMKKQRIFGETINENIDYSKLRKNLRSKRYKLFEEDGHLLAEKNRFSRWGPYVNHIGLILVLLGSMLRFVPAMYMDEFLWIREGETKEIAGTEGKYYIENEDFILETYDANDENNSQFQESLQNQANPVPENYQTNAVIYKRTDLPIVPGKEPELEKVKDAEARVNHPIQLENGISLYQASYQLNEFQSMTFKLHDKGNEDTNYGEFTVDLTEPKDEYTLDDGTVVRLDRYYPEFELDDGVPTQVSKFPRNPAFIFEVQRPGEEPEVSFAGIGVNIDATGENDYKVGLVDFGVRDVTGLTVKRDYTLPFIAFGAAIFMIGVIQGMYWNHRRIWIQPKETGVWVAGHTNKNWFALKKDIDQTLEDTGIEPPVDQQEEKDKRERGKDDGISTD
ncbi:cytochrome c biogenesis protein ResB [Salimicrobium halophilum]|uniref:Cytochrome c biogenesis protein n=1 Tax=Salimicrobium halophilum TaxID=86666 RepID=A0A1G8PYY8_9BACI|nr:cytochrome c biogenesis protein ResB [Salimicrobium halophilum]SDI97445.1 cytochrome c biogenesis protein [Salimicrobium halophilum]